MNFVGCDLHKNTITMCVVHQNRVPLASRRFSCGDTAGIVVWLAQFRPFQLVVEATATGSLLPVLLSSKALADKPPVAPISTCAVQRFPL